VKNCQGFTIVELLLVTAIAGILMGMGVLTLQSMNSPLHNGSAQLLGFFKQARAKAMATTAAYWVQPSSPTKIMTKFANNCSVDPATATADPQLVLDLPKGVNLTNTSWSLCFSSRGLAASSLTVTLQDVKNKSKSIEVFLGGAMRIQS
jgi:prepilin-type N-terminal cleavage/methylation domain-containing protein